MFIISYNFFNFSKLSLFFGAGIFGSSNVSFFLLLSALTPNKFMKFTGFFVTIVFRIFLSGIFSIFFSGAFSIVFLLSFLGTGSTFTHVSKFTDDFLSIFSSFSSFFILFLTSTPNSAFNSLSFFFIISFLFSILLLLLSSFFSSTLFLLILFSSSFSFILFSFSIFSSIFSFFSSSSKIALSFKIPLPSSSGNFIPS